MNGHLPALIRCQYSNNCLTQEYVKKGKYTDFEYFHNGRLAADNFCRSDNIRIFSAGLCSTNEYYLLNKRLNSFDSTVAY